MTLERVAHYLLHWQIVVNPMPWRVVSNWTYEVTASNDAVVAKCQKHEEAMGIIQLAEKINRESGADDWPVSEATENIRDLLVLSHEERCNHPLGHSENLSVSCMRPKGHQGPHKGI